MKINQNSNELIVKKGAGTQVFIGSVFVLFGLVAIVTTVLEGANGQMAFIVFGAIFAIIGGLLAFFASSQDVTLRPGGTSTVTSKRIFGGKAETVDFATDRVVAVQLLSGMERSSEGGMQRKSTVCLLMDDNEQIELATASSNANRLSINGIGLGSFGVAPLNKEAQQLAAFLNVRLDASDFTQNPIEAIKTAMAAVQNGRARADQPDPNQNPTLIVPSQGTADSSETQKK